MSTRERLAGIDLGAFFFSLAIAILAIAALSLLVDRLQRIAKAASLGADREWIAPSGAELRLAGLAAGPLLGIETSPGGGLTVTADQARLLDGRQARPLIWASEGDPQADNKSEIEVSLVSGGGSVLVSRSGETEVPQLRIAPQGTALRVDSGVTIGDRMVAPVTRTIVGQQEIPATGPGFSFIVPPGSALEIEFPALPNGDPSGVVTRLGEVRTEEEDSILPVREVSIAQEGAHKPDKAACAAGQTLAWGMFLRRALFPLPTGSDCAGGIMTARGLSITGQSVGVSLAGRSAWIIQDGMPISSLWSWTKKNPVLELVVNKLLPWAVGLIFGLVVWRRKTAPKSPVTPRPISGRSKSAE